MASPSDNDKPTEKKSNPYSADYSVVLNALPALIWALLAVAAMVLFRKPIIKLIGRVSKVAYGSFQAEIASQAITRIKQFDNITGIPKGPGLKRILKRAQNETLMCKLEHAHILWVDDAHPSQNVAERRALESFGIHFDLANSTEEATRWLDRAHYDAVISDLTRDGDPTNKAACSAHSPTPSGAGCALANKIHDQYKEDAPPIILYTAGWPSNADTPRTVFGLTNRVDQLFNLVFDALDHRMDCPHDPSAD